MAYAGPVARPIDRGRGSFLILRGIVVFSVAEAINWLAVALSTVAFTALGGAWVAVLFAKLCAQALVRDQGQPPDSKAV